jgi:hypothetical protein
VLDRLVGCFDSVAVRTVSTSRLYYTRVISESCWRRGDRTHDVVADGSGHSQTATDRTGLVVTQGLAYARRRRMRSPSPFLPCPFRQMRFGSKASRCSFRKSVAAEWGVPDHSLHHTVCLQDPMRKPHLHMMQTSNETIPTLAVSHHRLGRVDAKFVHICISCMPDTIFEQLFCETERGSSYQVMNIVRLSLDLISKLDMTSGSSKNLGIQISNKKNG